MDGRGRWMDNVFIERLWRSLSCAAISYAVGQEETYTPLFLRSGNRCSLIRELPVRDVPKSRSLQWAALVLLASVPASSFTS